MKNIYKTKQKKQCYATFILAHRLQHCHFSTWSPLLFHGYSSYSPCRFGLWIDVNSLWSVTLGRASGLLIYWQDTGSCLVIPLWQVVIAKLYKYKQQSGECQACLKATLHWFFWREDISFCMWYYNIQSNFLWNKMISKNLKAIWTFAVHNRVGWPRDWFIFDGIQKKTCIFA